MVFVALAGALSGCVASPSAIVELDRPAAKADSLPEDLRYSGIYPATARHAGTVDGVEIFLAAGPVGNRGWGPARDDRGVEFCLIALERGGTWTSSCGRLPLGLQTAKLDLQLIGSAAATPEGYERLSESVVVRG